MSYDEHLISMAGGDGEPRTSDMADVILRSSLLDLQDSLALARELAAAGFGLVREAQAVALEEAADGWQAYIRAMNWGTTRPIDWLRARAVTVRGGE